MATVYDTAKSVFAKLAGDPKGRALLQENDQTFLFEVTDGPLQVLLSVAGFGVKV